MMDISVICAQTVLCVTVISVFVCCAIGQDARNLADVPCGQQWRRGSRIVGGQNAVPGEFPWLVSIRRSGGHFCGGTIVHRKWVVTAGHCMCSGPSTIPQGQLEVSLGEYNLKKPDHPTFIRVRRIHLHPEYRCPRFVNDIALLELEEDIDWNTSVGPACLPYFTPYSLPTTYSASEATAAGWGWVSEQQTIGNRADVLQKVNVRVVDNLQCQDWYKSQGKKVNILESQICAGDEQGGRDSCWADSGGPLMVKNSEGMVVVGVVSTGIGCGRAKLPGLYTRVTSYMPWVLDMVEGPSYRRQH